MIERPAARYGRQRPHVGRRRWLAVAFTLLALAVGVTVAVVAFGRFESEPVTGELGAYELIDDETVSVTISVTREDPSQPVVCIVRARSIDGAETGRREVLVPPSSQQTVQVTAPVKATRQPVIGDIYGCGTDVPPYLTIP
ncbi:DUF4307 domain-containing protein [Mycolicibacterium novocastrense]|uniref:DUF4307 domain-containing protein n=1 Tax=Mycolicibacterium novocastrense TaxID=59813 RepID=A0AAW5SER8_MYCNV|nr:MULTISPECIES: DUF4307 domain-containing protein [Mycobacteriaceae]MCV7022553.1 DUF4307 domain-containing protein [Mycolicibacterium novocastrense]GAT08219.1 uncharacterized protein RMCN_1352 [Mycolicibacterium novocastrense]